MKVNWVAKLFVYFAIVVIAGPFFDNWTSTEKILFLADAYSYKCPQDRIFGPTRDKLRCEEQQLAISHLLSYARMMEFASSVVIGICVDSYGPRIVALFGILFSIVSWAFMAFFPTSGVMLKLSMVLIGISTNATLFPAITIERYTRKYRSQVLIFICSSSSFTCFLVKLLEIIILRTGSTPKKVSLYFILFFILPCFVAGFFIFPDDVKADVNRIGQPDARLYISTTSITSAIRGEEGRTGDECRRDEENSLEYNSLETRLEKVLGSVKEKEDGAELEEVEEELTRKPSNASIHVVTTNPSSTNLTNEANGKGTGSRVRTFGRRTSDWNWRGFFNSMKKIELVIAVLYFCLNVVSLTYSQQSYTITYSDEPFLLEFSEYVLPLSFIPCALFMVFMRFFSPYLLIMTVGALWSALSVFSIFHGYTTGILTATLFTIAYSIYNTHVYIYVEENANKDYYSSILGLANLAGGLSTLINIPLLWIKDKKNMDNIHISMLVIRVAFLALFTYRYYVKKVAAARSAASGTVKGAHNIVNIYLLLAMSQN